MTIVKRGHLEVPVIGVAKSAWNLKQFRARAKEASGSTTAQMVTLS
jgi:glucose-6-phosphate 1-dehydrogenase